MPDEFEIMAKIDALMQTLDENVRRRVSAFFAAKYGYSHSDRTKAAMIEARARGAQIGAQVIMTDEKVAEARRMLADRKSVAKIAAHLGVSKPTIYNHLPETRRHRQERDAE